MTTQFEKILVGLEGVRTEQKNTQDRLVETNTGLRNLSEKVEAHMLSTTAQIAVHEERLDTIAASAGKKAGVVATAISAAISTVAGGLVIFWRVVHGD